METPTMGYNETAIAFLEKTKVKFSVQYVGYGPYFDGEKESRSIYRFTLRRGLRSYTAKFGQSIASEGQEPTEYDILSCLTKYEPGTFENFCSEFGYDTDSRKALKTYHAVCREYTGVCRIWNEAERELLAEIN